MPNIKNIAITAVAALGLVGFSYLYLKDDSTQLKKDVVKVNNTEAKVSKDVPIIYHETSKKRPDSSKIATSDKKKTSQVSAWRQEKEANPSYQRYKAYQHIVAMRERKEREFESNLKRRIFLQKAYKEKMMKIAMAKRDRIKELKRRQMAKILQSQRRNQMKMINKATNLHLNANGS